MAKYQNKALDKMQAVQMYLKGTKLSVSVVSTFDRKVEESRQRLADAAAKREVGEFQALVDERDRNSAMEKRKRRKLES